MAASRTEEAPPEQFQLAIESLRAVVLRPEVVVQEAPAPQRLAPWSVALTADVVSDEEELASGRLVLLHDPAGHEAWEGVFRLVTFVRAELEADMAADPLLPAVAWGWLEEALEVRGAAHVAWSGTVTRVASQGFGGLSDRPPSAEVEIRASWTPVLTSAPPVGSARGVPARPPIPARRRPGGAPVGGGRDAGSDGRLDARLDGRLDARPRPAARRSRRPGIPAAREAVPDLGAHLHAWAELLCTSAGLPPVPPGVVALPARRAPGR